LVHLGAATLQLRRLEEEDGITPTTNGNSNSQRWTQIPSPKQQQQQQDTVANGGGFANPVSIDVLWQAADLRAPECRLAVGLHVRHGVIRHVLPALNLFYNADNNHHHRNRGLCTVPRAHQWMDFGAYLAGFGKQSLRLQTRRKNNDDDDEEWQTMLQLESIADTVNKAITALAEEPPTALGDGCCIVHVVWAESTDRIECPTTSGSEIRLLLSENDDDDDDTVVGTLHVRVETTAAGSESEYLPDAYKPLFGDVSFRRAAYTEAKRRLQEQKADTKY
jgi:hypothetical protein